MKFFVCDVEGTIFKAKIKIEGTDYLSTMWQSIAVALGDAAVQEEKISHEKWDNLEFDNYLEWVRATIEIHRKYGLKKDTFDALIKSAEYNEGVEEFFNELNRQDYIPVLISGGFQNLIRRAQNELDIEYGFGACEYNFDEYGYLANYSLQPSDFKGKIHFLDTLFKAFKKLNKKTDWIFVGDGKNDVDIAKQAPLAFGINPHDKLKAVNGLIEINSFMDILPYLDNALNQTKNEILNIQAGDISKNKSKKHANDEDTLKQKVFRLERDIRTLKQKLSDQKGKAEKKQHAPQISINELDYVNIPRKSLDEILKDLKVVFLGMDENSAEFLRLNNIQGLRIIPGMKNNIDTRIIQNADFLFIYKNCITHSDIWHACNGASTPPCCFLLEHSNKKLLENAMANVLYRYIYK